MERFLRSSGGIAWGEFWIYARVFSELGLADNLDNHLKLCRDYQMDFVSLPINSNGKETFSGYHWFDIADITKVSHLQFFTVAVINGLWQTLTDRLGVFRALKSVVSYNSGIEKEIAAAAQTVSTLAADCSGAGASAVLFADDLASWQTTLISPASFEKLFLGCYSSLVNELHRLGSRAIFHSDGNITSILPQIVSAGFDGINVQQECVNLPSLPPPNGLPVIFTSIPLSLMDSPSFQPGPSLNELPAFAENHRLVLCSCSGLDSLTGLKNSQRIRDLMNSSGG